MTQDTDIYNDLHRRLVAGEFVHGTKLRAEQLKADYACSASTIREALFRLSIEGLTDFQEQRGFRVPLFSRQRQHELTHMRILLEGEGTCLSIRHGGIAWEARVAAAHHQLSHIESRLRGRNHASDLLELWTRAELEFHQTLISDCGSEVLKRTHLLIFAQFRQQLMISDKSFDFVSENIAQHQAIVDAALEGNEPKVRQKIHDHLARNLIQTEPAII
jgi:DNA-binding GntR family transcriptional regulator